MEKKKIKNFTKIKLVLQPYAMKVARTVDPGGKLEKAYLSEQTL